MTETPSPEALDVAETLVNHQWGASAHRVALALDRFRAAGVREGVERTIGVIKGGRFLHDDAPPARFAKEVVTAIRREIPKDAAQPAPDDVERAREIERGQRVGAVLSGVRREPEEPEKIAAALDQWHPIDELPPNQVAFFGCWQKDTAGRPVWQYARGLVQHDARSVVWLGEDYGAPTHFHPQLSPPATSSAPAGFVPFDKVALFARAQGMRDAAQWLDARACHIRDNGPKSEEGVLDARAGALAGELFDAAAELRALAANARSADPECQAGSQ